MDASRRCPSGDGRNIRARARLAPRPLRPARSAFSVRADSGSTSLGDGTVGCHTSVERAPHLDSSARRRANAARFFATLDVNHDGEIDPDEINRYETVVAPEIDTSPGGRIARAELQNQAEGSGGRGHRGGHHRGGGGYGGSFGAGGGFSGDLDDPLGGGRFGLLNIPEPVASADADFNRGVTLDEFKRAALQRFQLLDSNRSGRLTLAALEEQRAATIAAARRPHGASAEPAEGDSEGGSPY